MTNAIAITAHHDDAVLWCGGTILRTRTLGWRWSIVAMCVPDPQRQVYFDSYSAATGAVGRRFSFVDYQDLTMFSRNKESEFEAVIQQILNETSFDFIFTHSQDPGGEYGGHANHDEVLRVTKKLVPSENLIHFCYAPEFGGNGRGTTARRDADYHLQLNYDELIQKAGWCRMAPDAMSNLKGIGFPCPNLEGFRTARKLQPPFIHRD